jgi:hypothetical protein
MEPMTVETKEATRKIERASEILGKVRTEVGRQWSASRQWSIGCSSGS